MSELKKLLANMLPLYECTLPFSKQKVSFTPFKVKDIKNISIMLEENDKNSILKGMIQILKSNSIDIDVMDLCMADAEYLFLQIRAKSVDEILNLLYNNMPIKLNIYDIKCRNNYLNEEIPVSDGFSLLLKTPKLKDLVEIDINDENAIIQKSIKRITVSGEVYDVEKYISEEAKQIIENMPIKTFNKLKKIMEKMPELYASIEIDGEEKEVSGSQSFFIFR